MNGPSGVGSSGSNGNQSERKNDSQNNLVNSEGVGPSKETVGVGSLFGRTVKAVFSETRRIISIPFLWVYEKLMNLFSGNRQVKTEETTESRFKAQTGSPDQTDPNKRVLQNKNPNKSNDDPNASNQSHTPTSPTPPDPVGAPANLSVPPASTASVNAPHSPSQPNPSSEEQLSPVSDLPQDSSLSTMEAEGPLPSGTGSVHETQSGQRAPNPVADSALSSVGTGSLESSSSLPKNSSSLISTSSDLPSLLSQEGAEGLVPVNAQFLGLGENVIGVGINTKEGTFGLAIDLVELTKLLSTESGINTLMKSMENLKGAFEEGTQGSSKDHKALTDSTSGSDKAVTKTSSQSLMKMSQGDQMQVKQMLSTALEKQGFSTHTTRRIASVKLLFALLLEGLLEAFRNQKTTQQSSTEGSTQQKEPSNPHTMLITTNPVKTPIWGQLTKVLQDAHERGLTDEATAQLINDTVINPKLEAEIRSAQKLLRDRNKLIQALNFYKPASSSSAGIYTGYRTEPNPRVEELIKKLKE